MSKEYKDRQDKPLVNPAITSGEYEKSRVVTKPTEFDRFAQRMVDMGKWREK